MKDNMAIKTVFKVERKCNCTLPRKARKDEYLAGDVVQCTDCDSYWRCTGWSPIDQYKPGDETLLWERVRKLWSSVSQKTVWEKF
jgi:hypothetical protein